MAARRSGRQAGAIFLSLFGCALMVLGGWHMLRLERTHVPEEILYRGSPDTLVLWLASLDIEDAETAERMRDRLLSMPLSQRRDAVLALAGLETWTKFTRRPDDVRNWQRVALEAAKGAVALAPTAGDLWFLVGVLNARLTGYGDETQRYLALSATYTPRELELVLARLTVLATAWPLLHDNLKDLVRRDFAIVESAAPKQAEDLKAILQRSGADLDG